MGGKFSALAMICVMPFISGCSSVENLLWQDISFQHKEETFEEVKATGNWGFSKYTDDMTDATKLVSTISSGDAVLLIRSIRGETDGFEAYLDYNDDYICATSGANFMVGFDDDKPVKVFFDRNMLSSDASSIFFLTKARKNVGSYYEKNQISSSQFIQKLRSSKKLRIKVSDSCGGGGTFLFPLDGSPHLRVGEPKITTCTGQKSNFGVERWDVSRCSALATMRRLSR
jgi:hypothetical protein